MSSTNSKPLFQIKGIKDGLLITLGEGDWQSLQSQLFNQIQDQTNFFKGAKLYLEVGYLILHAVDVSALRDKLADHHITLVGIISYSPTTDATARLFGLATKLPESKIERGVGNLSTKVNGEAAVLIHRTMRSGYKIKHEGHIIIIGDVNPGAEIESGGSIVVWGRLLGQAVAGSGGDDLAVVCALEMEPSLLRIHEKTYSLGFKKKKGRPLMAMIINDEIEIKDWDTKEK